jgi:DNA-binding GntR family transcriptional regulator
MTVPLRTPSLVDALHESLRARILAGDESPGTAITEMLVATQYDVARPTAKAAIERLISDGLLVRSGRRGAATIPRLTGHQIADLYRTRIVLETAAHELLSQTDADLTRARSINAGLADSAERGDAPGLVDADVAFHRELVGATGSPRLSRLHDLLMSEAHLCMSQVQARQLLAAQLIWEEHERILQAIGAGDAALARAATVSHLEQARDKLAASINALERSR